ncbi:capsule assembly Wzi family protein [Roseivirga sp. E12]|uniref:capsule assembly Wzi family protein n=1 Tax=Roseivirga sp. E12 TaxID=2819237 RepID=UPI001ABD14D2|nr:capsule assembly Wzi family protein [Roseivirga sp. E12]MBO3699727.1 hypothetical protein [Roseivirga sp. E12]
MQNFETEGFLQKISLTICLVFSSLLAVSAQERDSLNLSIGLGTLVSSETSFLPFHLVSNQWGEVKQEGLFVRGDLTYMVPVLDKMNFVTGFSFRNKFLSSHFIRLKYREIEISVGREKWSIGGLGNTLSSGSMGVSSNARPIPMVNLRVADYINVPFTGGYFKTKGHLNHGWFEEDRYISKALLHSKSFYLKLDLDKEIGWTASSGLVHFAQYGGISPQGDKQPSSLSDFFRVFAGSGIPNLNSTTEGESNGLGNHLGIIDTHVTQRVGEHTLTLNYQKPFEDFGGLQYISLTDYLIGLEWSLPNIGSLINTIYFEYVQTKWQGGPGLPDATSSVPTEVENFGYSFGGRDDIYNNWLYRSGWTYDGDVIGNPLFLTHQRTLNFFENYPDYDVAIANNRLRAVHLGIRGEIKRVLLYEGLFTYTQNFGTYAGLYEGRFAWDGVINDTSFDYVFRPMREQFYMQFKFRCEEVLKELPISLELKVAYDFGDLYHAFGSEFSLYYDLTKG